jgi:hypothetical protein
MANTKATIRTRLAVFGFVAIGYILAMCAGVNVFGTFTPIENRNEQIDVRLQAAITMPGDQKTAEFQTLKNMQEKALTSKPSEPYGWARLSYLRHVTGDDDKSAFAALRMSDLVSPFEVQQLPERAAAWMKFSNVENEQQRDYQDTLWRKAFTLADDTTWALAQRLNITKYVGEALARKNSDAADGWHSRMREANIPF